ncbi:MAG: vancomycin resistance histidine kinase VanS [Velocimicrobium sp.]
MTAKLLGRVIIEMVGLAVVLTILYFLGRFTCSFRTWQQDEPAYFFLNALKYYLPYLVLFIIMIGIIVLLIRAWLQALGYLEDVLNATENVYSDKNSLIDLPPELKEVESQMNQIKFNLSESKQVAKEAEQRKNDLVVYLAHDLKTPLTSVIGYLTLLRDESQVSDELREKYLSISLNKAERLEDLINEFFEITRFNLSNITLEFSRVNLTRMLEQLIYEFKPMLLDKNLQCVLNLAPDIMIKCDVDKMQRVFDNLLRNAVNYSFDDSVIDIAVMQSEKTLKINFVNHGNTISREKLDRIFEQFYRLDSARVTKTGGAGLGLAIAKEIVELHGGKITAISENEMINFELTIPSL